MLLAEAEVYDVGLGFIAGSRPRIDAITSPLNPGENLSMSGVQFGGVGESSSGNTMSSPTDYPVIQLRHLDTGQTAFLNATSWTSNACTSEMVWNFPPGPAVATVFVNGISSQSQSLSIPTPVPTSTTITGVCVLTNGTVQFGFTNTIGAPLTVATATDLSMLSTNWSPLGGVVEVAPGQFRFNDSQPANQAQNFYRVQGL